MLYRTMYSKNSAAFDTAEAPQAPQAPQTPQAPQAFEAMQAPPGLILHLMDNDQDRDFRTFDGQTSNVSNDGSQTSAVELILTSIVLPRPTYRADSQIGRGNDPDPDPSKPSSSDDEAGRRHPIMLNAARYDGKREVTPYKVKSTELKLGG